MYIYLPENCLYPPRILCFHHFTMFPAMFPPLLLLLLWLLCRWPSRAADDAAAADDDVEPATGFILSVMVAKHNCACASVSSLVLIHRTAHSLTDKPTKQFWGENTRCFFFCPTKQIIFFFYYFKAHYITFGSLNKYGEMRRVRSHFKRISLIIFFCSNSSWWWAAPKTFEEGQIKVSIKTCVCVCST